MAAIDLMRLTARRGRGTDAGTLPITPDHSIAQPDLIGRAHLNRHPALSSIGRGRAVRAKQRGGMVMNQFQSPAIALAVSSSTEVLQVLLRVRQCRGKAKKERIP